MGCDPNTWEAESPRILTLKLAWATQTLTLKQNKILVFHPKKSNIFSLYFSLPSRIYL